MSLASAQDFAQRLGTQFDPTDLRVVRALEDATGLIQAYTGQTFTLVTDEEVALNGSGTRALVLPEVPVTEVSDVAILADDGTMTILEPTDYRLLGAEGILVGLSGITWGYCWPYWPKGYANVLVTYTHGYATIPAAIKAACCKIAARLEQSLVSAGASGAISGETIGGYQVTYTSGGETVDTSTGLTSDEMILLNAYRQVPMA